MRGKLNAKHQAEFKKRGVCLEQNFESLSVSELLKLRSDLIVALEKVSQILATKQP